MLYSRRLAAKIGRRQLEAIQQRAPQPASTRRSTEAAEKIQRRLAGHVAVKTQFARQVADSRAHLETLRLAIRAEDGRPPGGRPHEIEQNPDRRRLAGAIQTEEAEDLAGLHVERDVSAAP